MKALVRYSVCVLLLFFYGSSEIWALSYQSMFKKYDMQQMHQLLHNIPQRIETILKTTSNPLHVLLDFLKTHPEITAKLLLSIFQQKDYRSRFPKLLSDEQETLQPYLMKGGRTLVVGYKYDNQVDPISSILFFKNNHGQMEYEISGKGALPAGGKWSLKNMNQFLKMWKSPYIQEQRLKQLKHIASRNIPLSKSLSRILCIAV